jgi:hypothetical protein
MLQHCPLIKEKIVAEYGTTIKKKKQGNISLE